MLRWQGAEKLRLSTGGEFRHVQALVRRYADCAVHLAFEAYGLGDELAWWARENGVAVTATAPSRMERAPGLQVKTDPLKVGGMARQLEGGRLAHIGSAIEKSNRWWTALGQSPDIMGPYHNGLISAQQRQEQRLWQVLRILRDNGVDANIAQYGSNSYDVCGETQLICAGSDAR